MSDTLLFKRRFLSVSEAKVNPLLLLQTLVAIVTTFSSPLAPAPFDTTPVNAVLGDASFVARFGRSPGAQDPEALRLRVHLAYVSERLRLVPSEGLPPDARTRRGALLDALDAYTEAGVFPRNRERPTRTPVFIDDAGRLCAVGHLIARSAGRALAEAVDARQHLSTVHAMTGEHELIAWAATHGFTVDELAMIQPSYGRFGDYPWYQWSVDGMEPGELPQPDGTHVIARRGSVVAGEIRGGLPHGLWSRREQTAGGASESLAITGIGTFTAGQGLWTARHPDGTVAASGEYRDGLAHGPWRFFHPSGALAAEGELWRGLRWGNWRFFDVRGRLAAEGRFEHEEVGRWRYFDGTTGKVLLEEDHAAPGFMTKALEKEEGGKTHSDSLGPLALALDTKGRPLSGTFPRASARGQEVKVAWTPSGMMSMLSSDFGVGSSTFGFELRWYDNQRVASVAITREQEESLRLSPQCADAVAQVAGTFELHATTAAAVGEAVDRILGALKACPQTPASAAELRVKGAPTPKGGHLRDEGDGGGAGEPLETLRQCWDRRGRPVARCSDHPDLRTLAAVNGKREYAHRVFAAGERLCEGSEPAVRECREQLFQYASDCCDPNDLAGGGDDENCDETCDAQSLAERRCVRSLTHVHADGLGVSTIGRGFPDCVAAEAGRIRAWQLRSPKDRSPEGLSALANLGGAHGGHLRVELVLYDVQRQLLDRLDRDAWGALRAMSPHYVEGLKKPNADKGLEGRYGPAITGFRWLSLANAHTPPARAGAARP